MTASSASKSVPANTSALSAEHHLADKTLIIFDWDGTLMDSIGLIVESVSYTHLRAHET